MEYVQLLLAVVLLAVDFAFVKLYQIRQGQGMLSRPSGRPRPGARGPGR